jgi:hypothetical protein
VADFLTDRQPDHKQPGLRLNACLPLRGGLVDPWPCDQSAASAQYLLCSLTPCNSGSREFGRRLSN